MATGKIQIKPTLSANISSGGVTDHNRLFNRELEDQHPISAITGLEELLAELSDNMLDADTVLPIIEEASKGKAKGLYYDAMKEFDKKAYWYVTSEIDPITKQGTKDSIISGPYNLGAGGGAGGGGGGITTVTVKAIDWPSTTVVGALTKIKVNWTSVMGEEKEPTGNGTIYIIINDKQVEVKPNQVQGDLELDVTKYLASGSNTIQVKALDNYGTVGITVGVINAVTLELKSNFNADLSYNSQINYTYIPYGDIQKTVYFLIDGEQYGKQVVNATGEQQTFIIKNLKHGSHTLEVYFTAQIGTDTVYSNRLFYDLVYYEVGNETPIIVSDFRDFEQEQYIPFNIPYRVFIYNKNSFDINLAVNDEVVQSLTVNTDVKYWEYKNDIPGNYTLAISCGDTVKSFEIHIAKSAIDVQPVTDSLVLALSAQGRTNSENTTDRSKWEYTNPNTSETISCEMTDFNWSSNGWVKDSDNNTVLRLSGDARVTIPFLPFEKNCVSTGKTIELEIATSSVRNYSSTIISCLDKTKINFFEASTTFANIDDRQYVFTVGLDNNILSTKLLETGDHVFNYTEDGWLYNSEVVDLDDYGILLTKSQINPDSEVEDFILVGDVITIKYSFEAKGFYVTPQIAAFRSQQSAISTQYKEDEHVRITFVIEKNTDNRIIWMYIDGIASGAMQYPAKDDFRQLSPDVIKLGSNDAVLDIYNIRIYENNLISKQVVNNWIADTQDASLRANRYRRNDNYNDKNELIISKLPVDIPYIVWDIDPLPEFKGDKRLGNACYVDPTNSDRNFTVEDGEYNVQGTSSSVYPTKNIRMRMRSKNGPGYAWYDDNGETITKFPITYPNGIGDNYFTFKVDFASSEGANNVELTKLYNDAAKKAGILTPPQALDSRVRVGIDGFPVVAFHRDSTGKDIFCTKANFNNDKANESVYGFDGDWENKVTKELWDGDESWEITNNSANEAKFKVPVTQDNLFNGFEIRFPDEDGYNKIDKIGPMTAWVASTNREAATGAALEEPLEYTYTESVLGEDGSLSEIERKVTYTHDTAEYRLAKFKVELQDWFNVDSTLFYYVFTHLYLMIDSRAKNAFPTYFKSRVAGDGGDRWFWLPYDMDTAIGIDNKGKLSFDYYLEDTDKLDGADVFNGQDSVMWNNVRDAFAGEVAAMYAKMRLSCGISFEETERRFEEHQLKWSENIFNEDAKNKYITPLSNGDNYLEMLQGSKSQQRKWWLYNRFKYMDSKYKAGDAIKDFIQFRAYVDEGIKKPDIVITPYADIYATVSYANGRVVSKRAKRNEPIIIKNPFDTAEKENDQETYIYSASQLKSIGDISPFKPDTVKVGNAVKLQDLKVGDGADDYTNPHLTELTLGSNVLLKTLDARNCINLGTGVTAAPDISNCINIEELYFEGTKITGIELPNGGNLKVLHLPDTLTSLVIRNQPLLNDLQIAGTQKIEKLWLENIPSSVIKSEDMVTQMPDNAAIRLIGINEEYSSAEAIRAFYDKLDTMSGLDPNGETLPGLPQVTGVIYVDEITYADYISFLARYPEVKINAKKVLCTVNFYNEDTLFNSQIVVWDRLNPAKAVDPGIPEKSSTQQYYYIFNSWDKDLESIQSNIDIYAIYDEFVQQYDVIFDTQSTAISVEPNSVTLYYGDSIPTYSSGSIEIITFENIPENVTFTGWYLNGDLSSPWGAFNEHGVWEFGDKPITDTVHLMASWHDEGAPTVRLARKSAQVFTYNCYDNVGISDWAIIARDEMPEDNEWNHVDVAAAEFNGEYEINRTGNFYFWIKDAQGNTAHSVITAYSLETVVQVDPLNPNPIATLAFREGDIEGLDVSNYAIAGTTLVLVSTMDTHYENKKIQLNDTSYNESNPILVGSNLKAVLTCSPKIYKIQFYLFDKGTAVEAQEVTYLHKIESPVPQADGTYIIQDWWVLDSFYQKLRKFDFETEIATESLVLGANWIEYHDPSVFIIETTEDNQEVSINLTLGSPAGTSIITQNYSVRIEWDCHHGELANENDNFQDENIWEIHTSTEHFNQYKHVYPKAGIYILKIASVDGLYYFGGGNTYTYEKVYGELGNTRPVPAISPIHIVKKVMFSWDTPYTNIEAFANATGLTELDLTQYMITIAGSTFENCTNLERVYLPNNLTTIGSAAFKNCTNLKLVGSNATTETLALFGTEAAYSCSKLPEDLLVLAESAFQGCSSLVQVKIPNKLTYLALSIFANCTSLIGVDIPGNIKSINESAFNGCASLQSIIIPETVNSIGSNAFNSCTALNKVIIMGSNTTIGSTCFAFCNLLNTAGPIGSTDASGLPVDLEFAWDTEIPDYAFSSSMGTAYWTEIYLPETITKIGEQAFIYCNKVDTLDLSKLPNLTYIGRRAFEGCDKIVDLTIPSSVEFLGYRAFSLCLGLKNIYLKPALIQNEKPETKQDSWFLQTVYTATIHLPNSYSDIPVDELAQNLSKNYGTYWNYCRNNTAGEAMALSYTISTDF